MFTLPREHEYEKTYNAVAALFGHDPEAVEAWQLVYHSLPVFTPHGMRAAQTSAIVASWVDRRKPADDYTLSQIIGSETGVPYPRVVQALKSRAVDDQFHSPLDVRLDRLRTQPNFESYEKRSDLLRQLKARAEGHKYDAPRSSFVQMLAEQPDGPKSVYTALSNVGKALERNPESLIAYKMTITDAAKNLGWDEDQVHEAVWRTLAGVAAGSTLGIDRKKITDALDSDAAQRGWTSHESRHLADVVDTLSQRKANEKVARQLGEKLHNRTAESSRPGILRKLSPTRLAVVAPGDAAVNAQAVISPVRDAMTKHMQDFGFGSKDHQKTQMGMGGEPLQLMAHYDRPLDFGTTLDRVHASNVQPLIQGLTQVLQQSGIIPKQVAPAIHDLAGQTRTSIVALGQYANPQAPKTGAAWVGLLGRQPGMLSFEGNPQGKDSIYTFHHHDAAIVRNVLQNAGVPSRTIVPFGNDYQVYIYDPGNKLRGNVASALSQLRATATEWRGTGKVLGGETEDMGRAQYRGVINRSEGGGGEDGGEKQPVQNARPITDLEALFRGVVQKPRDDARWLILADKFDDLGKPNFAAFLRLLTKTRPSREITSFTGGKPRYVRDVYALPSGPMYRSPNMGDVIRATAHVGPVPIEATLNHGILPGTLGKRSILDTESDTPFGKVSVLSNPGREVGRGVIDAPTLEGIVHEATPRPGVYNKPQTFHGVPYLEHMKTRIRQSIERNRQAEQVYRSQNQPAEPRDHSTTHDPSTTEGEF